MNRDTRHLDRRLSSNSGQSLILAVIVMFLLVFLGIMFILVVSRNLTRTARSTDVTEATALAEAGIRYADRMLTTSEEGADWRPAPDNIGWNMQPDGTLVQDASLPDLQANHPDFKWLRPYWPVEQGDRGPTGGFTSFKSGSGRFLLRVSYDPNPDDPLSKHIKIESIGRVGYVDVNDPTTWGPASKIKLRRELTAYKPIGVTDYIFFVTNKDKKNTPIGLGCPGYSLQLGRPENGSEPFYGAPVRVNGDLTWYGNEVSIYLRGKTVPVDPDNPAGPLTYLPIDTVEVAGEIAHDLDPTGNNPIEVRLWESIDGNPASNYFTVYPTRPVGTNTPEFTTANGFYRDGDEGTDANQFSRNVKRLEPPLLDEENPSTKITRYRMLTQHSGTWREDPDGNRYNTGRIGWGKGIYINNQRDRQEESSSLFGGFNLRSDWTKPNNDMSSNWKGPYYVPPGVVITLNPEDTDGDNQPDMTITRTDTTRNNRKWVWRDYNNVPRPEWGQTITMPYPTPNRRIPDPDNIDDRSKDIAVPGNGVLFAEGNIRIKGMLPPGVQLTVVSNGTIYIEGNILKNRHTDDNGNITVDPTSAISLLARDYICVNTTQFMGLLSELGPMSIGSDAMNGEPPYHIVVTPEPGSNFRSTFVFGPPDMVMNQVDPRIFVRHAGQYGPTYINMWLNPQIAGGGLYPWNVPGYPPVPFFGVGDSAFGASGSGQTTVFRCDVWDLLGAGLPALNGAVGYPNYVEIGIDQQPFQSLPGYIPVVPELRNYLLSAFAIQPMDVRIEAVMYAQEKSFFVIPGPWFNPDPEDVPGSPSSAQKRDPNYKLVDPMFPYFGQGLDIKVTIFGAVSMNMPASLADTSEWMDKWGRIPETYGSSNERTAHPGQGLTFLYDPMVGWPTYQDAGGKQYLRRDPYGRPLPVTPRLPVCTSLIYFGDAP